METLFPLDLPGEVPPIPGLTYRREYIREAEEQTLRAAIDAEPWDTSWDRRRQLYGGAYGRSAEPPRPIPDWGQTLAERMFREGLSPRPFDHMLINEYLPGQGIAMHRDYEPFDRTIVSLSLLSPCVMDFAPVGGGQKQALLLEPRSLIVLSDEARYAWKHGIARRKKDRWQGIVIPRRRRLSVTFRLMKQGARPGEHAP